jgi:hypothetical protein
MDLFLLKKEVILTKGNCKNSVEKKQNQSQIYKHKILWVKSEKITLPLFSI